MSGAQNTPGRAAAKGTVQIDNVRVRVTEWAFAPGAETGWHVHALDYVVVPQTSGNLLLQDAAGEKTAALAAGVPYFRFAGVSHNVINDNDFAFTFIEIELKD